MVCPTDGIGANAPVTAHLAAPGRRGGNAYGGIGFGNSH